MKYLCSCWAFITLLLRLINGNDEELFRPNNNNKVLLFNLDQIDDVFNFQFTEVNYNREGEGRTYDAPLNYSNISIRHNINDNLRHLQIKSTSDPYFPVDKNTRKYTHKKKSNPSSKSSSTTKVQPNKPKQETMKYPVPVKTPHHIPLHYVHSPVQSTPKVFRTDHTAPWDLNLNDPKTFSKYGFGAIYAINLEWRNDRLLKMKAIFNALKMKAKILTATSKFDAPVKFLQTKKEYFVEGQKEVNLGEIACYSSHLRIYRDIVHKDLPNALIFEDDIDVETIFPSQIEHVMKTVPNDWEIIFFGHCFEHKSLLALVSNIDYKKPSSFQSIKPLCLHGYAVRHSAAVKLLKYLPTAPKEAIDNAVRTMIMSGELKSYTVIPMIVNQLDLVEGITSDLRETHNLRQTPLNNSLLKSIGLLEK